MANLEFFDKHNMVAYLKKPTGSEGLQEIVDFLNGSHIRTVDNGEQEITAIADGKEFTTQTPGQALNKVTELPQTSEPIPNVADEAVYEELDDSVEKAAPTAASLDAEQDSGGSPRCQDALRGSIDQTRSERQVKKVKRLAKKDKLSKSRRKLRLVLLDEEGSDLDILAQEDPSKKGRKMAQMDEDEGITLVQIVQRVSTVSTYFTTANVPVTNAGAEISTASPKVKTVGDSVDDITDETLVYIRRSAAKEKDKARVEADEELAQRLQAEERNKYSEVDQGKMLVDLIIQRKRYFNLFETTIRRVNTFVPMETEVRRRVPELVVDSSQATVTESTEARGTKRAAEEELGQQSSKKQKPNELSQEELQQLMIIVPEEGMNIEALQTKYPIIDWENKVIVPQNAEFFKNSLITQKASGSLEDLELIQEEDKHPSENTSLHHDGDDQEIDKPQSDVIPIRRSTKTRHAPDRMCLYILNLKWLDAMNVEMQSMKDNKVWDLVDLPPNCKTIGSKWLFKKKTDMDGKGIKSYLEKCFAMKDLDEAAYIFGIKIYRDRSRQLIRLCQSAYNEKILKRFNMQNSKRGLILVQEKPKLKKVLQHLMRNTKDMFLVYGGDIKSELKVTCYTDVGYLTDVDDSKSHTEYVFVLNGGVVDWKSASLSIVATSSMEAEYMAA
nr:hypothetical protein [Tanacetum cinerariifolium]